MTMGFLDNGASFQKGLKILEEEFMLSQIISQQTMAFVSYEKEALMQNWDLALGKKLAVDYIQERW